MTISIVTSMYNRKYEVLEVIDNLFFPSLLNNGNSEMELIIIDDCSPLFAMTLKTTKKYIYELSQKFGSVTFIRNEYNLGFARSFNKGISMAKGDKIIVANDDIYFPLGSIEKLAATLDDSAGYLIAGPITNSNTGTFQYCKQAPTLKSYAPAEIAKLEKFSEWLSVKMNNRIMTTDNVCGFCFAIDPVLFKEMGGFDETYWYGFYEDTDLLQRIKKVYGEEKIAINLDIFVGHGGPNGFSRTMLQEPLKWNIALLINGIKYANRWGYRTWFKRLAYIVQVESGKGTITELLPENIVL